jgi:hypothetical protein
MKETTATARDFNVMANRLTEGRPIKVAREVDISPSRLPI